MFGKDKKNDGDKLQKIRSALKGAGGRDLRVLQKGETYEIHGEVDSIAEKQSVFGRVTDAAGDVGIVNELKIGDRKPQVAPDAVSSAAGARVDVPAGAADTAGGAGGRTYEVKKGDTLSHIAQRFYGKASEYRKIFEANRDQLDDPDEIKVGQKLRIPE